MEGARALAATAACLAATAALDAPGQGFNQEIVRVLNRPEVKERFLDSGVQTVGSTPGEFGATVRAEMSRLGRVIRDSNIRG